MADSKSQPNRLRSLRDSVKKITKRLSEGEGEMIHKNSEQARELDKLRVQIQSMEEEIRRLYQSRYQLDQATKQNEKLVATLQDAKAQIEALRAEVEKLTAPPSSYAIFSSLNEDGTGNVYVSGRKMKVSLHPSINRTELRKGREVVLNEALNVVEVKGFDSQGEVVRLKDVLEGGRALVTLHFDEEKVADLGDPLLAERLSVGDHLLYDVRSGYVIEKLPKSEAEELVLEEVPDVDYAHIGGLQKELEQVRDAVELPFLHPQVFAEYKLSAPKGVLLYGPPGCGKTLIAKAVANSIAKKLGDRSGKEIRSYFLHVKGPELLNKYVGESERQVREVFKKAKERAEDGHPVIVFFDEMDALFRTRGTGVSSDIESTIVPQFLSEIDGVERLRNVIVIGASNRQDLIDPAVLRAGRLDVKVKVGRPDADAARDIFSKYISTELPFAEEDVARHGGDRHALVERLTAMTVEAMYAASEENKFIEVTYANGEKEVLYFKDFASGALIEGIVSRAKKFAVKRVIANEGTGLRSDDLIRAIREEFKEHEDLPNTTNPDDWAKIAGKKGEKIIHLRTISGGPTEHRQIETIST
ncbi:MAG: proteasome ATPase, partial [Nitrospira sp.]|nr:proteasome ATPase [Nitrospira sp.]